MRSILTGSLFSAAPRDHRVPLSIPVTVDTLSSTPSLLKEKTSLLKSKPFSKAFFFAKTAKSSTLLHQ
ncbi:MAG: hypothetical protein DRJ63_04915 [Thermoprotei archaeon]|nr:MAG: hypothetical protein DRJ63_04915 [Thermoprotei archaeon]